MPGVSCFEMFTFTARSLPKLVQALLPALTTGLQLIGIVPVDI